MTPQEKTRAMQVSKSEYPEHLPCINCGREWMQHCGTLCPAEHSATLRNIGGMTIPVPWAPGDTTFLPDLEYFKTPDFDVV